MEGSENRGQRRTKPNYSLPRLGCLDSDPASLVPKQTRAEEKSNVARRCRDFPTCPQLGNRVHSSLFSFFVVCTLQTYTAILVSSIKTAALHTFTQPLRASWYFRTGSKVGKYRMPRLSRSTRKPHVSPPACRFYHSCHSFHSHRHGRFQLLEGLLAAPLAEQPCQTRRDSMTTTRREGPYMLLSWSGPDYSVSS